MILWLILIIAIIYYLGKENGYFNSHHQKRDNYGSYHSQHPERKNKFSAKKDRMKQSRDADLYEIKDDDPAFKIARERYAAGEITKAEFEEIKKNLKEDYNV